MTPDLMFWDCVGLGLALVFVLAFVAQRIKHAFTAVSGGGCGGCKQSAECDMASRKEHSRNGQKSVQYSDADTLQKSD